MTRYQYNQIEKTIYEMWRLEIIKQGYFDDWLEDSGLYSMAQRIANKTGYRASKVRKVYWKIFKPNEKDFLDSYQY